jgi:hypothetical protein
VAKKDQHVILLDKYPCHFVQAAWQLAQNSDDVTKVTFKTEFFELKGFLKSFQSFV